jgi:hypothetical protein
MAEAAAPAAAPANGAQTSAPAAARVNGGQFGPKDGATGITPPTPAAKAPPPAEPKKAEPWKVKLKVDDEEIELDEQRASQELKELRWRRKQQNETQAMKREAEELVRLAQTDEDAFFKKLGIDVDARAERKIQERLRLATMTPEQQELERAKAELDNRDKSVKQREAELAKLDKERKRVEAQTRNRQEYEAALGHSVLPHSRAKLFLMTQIQQGQREGGGPKLSPENLGRAYDEMMFSAFDELVSTASTKAETLARWPQLPKLAVSSLEKLDGAQLLQTIGPALERKILQATVARHRGQQTIPVQHANTPPPPVTSTGSFDEVELEQRKRDFLASFK